MYVIDQNNEGKMYYIYTDHASTTLSTGLGSPNLITDAQCNVVQELSYDAWGNRRDPATWQPYSPDAAIPTPFIDRGFTFHEHLYPFTLINMNGRAYDPLVGRFLSADPYIQAPDNTQNLNRYSYCLNNPLRYTDPQGEFLIEAMIIGGLANWLMSGAQLNSEGLLSFTVGAFSGFAGAGIGASAANAVTIGGFAGGFQVGAAGGAAGGFTGGAGYAWTHGASLGEGLLAGLTGAGIGAALGGLIEGISKGIADHKLGLDFRDGSGTIDYKDPTITYTQEQIDEAFKIAKIYNDPDYTIANDQESLAREFMNDEYGVKIGDYKLNNITTRTGVESRTGEPLRGIDNLRGCYVDKDGYGVLGYYVPNDRSLHISMGSLRNSTMFRAVGGHELIHAYHHYIFGGCTDWTSSEAVAYRYMYNEYYSGGMYISASFAYRQAVMHGLWGLYSKGYDIPSPFRFY